jgi:putative flippase GtrA
MSARTVVGSSLSGQVLTFAVVGTMSTLVHLGGFVLLRQFLEAATAANGISLLVAAMTNTWANRRWTFGVRGRAGAARHQAQGLVVLTLTLALTSGGLSLLRILEPAAPTWVETLVVAATTALATAVKFLAMKWWVFRPVGHSGETSARRSTETRLHV